MSTLTSFIGTSLESSTLVQEPGRQHRGSKEVPFAELRQARAREELLGPNDQIELSIDEFSLANILPGRGR